VELSHIDESGKARMVDVSAKPRVRRTATAHGVIHLAPETIDLVRRNDIAKGDVLGVARVAGVMAAKKTWDLIPLCHNIEIDQVTVDLETGDDRITITARAVCSDKTGIEMEALTAVSVAALTIYDMCKAVDKSMHIEAVRLLEKTKEEVSA